MSSRCPLQAALSKLLCPSAPSSPSLTSPFYLQGIDLAHGGRRVGDKHRKFPESGNVYVRMLSKLYTFLARRTDSGFNRVVSKRLVQSRVNRVPMGLARVARFMKDKQGKIAVVVANVTDDIRLDGHELPALKIAALRFTEGARARIVKAGGECLTFDQLAKLAPSGQNTVLLRGRRTARVATRYFGTPGSSGSTTRPRVRSEGRKVSLQAEIGGIGLEGGEPSLPCLCSVASPQQGAGLLVQAVCSCCTAVCWRAVLRLELYIPPLLWFSPSLPLLRCAVRAGSRPQEVPRIQGLNQLVSSGSCGADKALERKLLLTQAEGGWPVVMKGSCSRDCSAGVIGSNKTRS